MHQNYSQPKVKPKGLIEEEFNNKNFASNINANKFFEEHKYVPQNNYLDQYQNDFQQ